MHGLMSTLTVSLGVRALVYAHAWAERRERTSWGVRDRARVNCLSVCRHDILRDPVTINIRLSGLMNICRVTAGVAVKDQ